MSRIEPLKLEGVAELEDIGARSQARLGYIANSARILAHRPEIARAFMQLTLALHGPSSTLTPELRNLIGQVASRAAQSPYCMAHTAHIAADIEISAEKQDALWDFETSPLFSPAERAALRVAYRGAMVPNAVSDEDFAALKQHYNDEQIVEIVAIIATLGFLNRFNTTMACALEGPPAEIAERFLAPHGWSAGQHAPKT